MFKHFRSPFDAPAWAGFSPDDLFVASDRFGHGEKSHDKHHHGKHHHGKHHHGDEQHRTRRGDIKFILLELLSEQPRHGYDLIKQMEARHGGYRRLSPGSVYPTLQMLEEGGYLTGEPESGKRVYTITDAGRQLLSERSEQSANHQTIDIPQELIELRNVSMELDAAVKQVARNGNPERISRVRELLARCKREIYTILSEE